MAVSITLVLVVAFFGDLLSASPAASHSPVIDLGYSRYRGVSLLNGADEYLGMRFAAPPLKDLRFRAPQDPQHTGAVQDASSFGPICVGVGQSASNSLSEDCLFINVWKPANATVSSNYPVWMFFSGGGYADLSNANYNGSDVVQNSGHDIVFVNFNYRVGALGFLASDEIRKNGNLNVGLLDQRKAMEWVRTHISKFGGDPNHVVIHGDSAGGGSIAHHLVAYDGNNTNLFVGAIAESTFWPTQRTVAEMQFQYDKFVKDVNCDQAVDPLACLRAADISTIQQASNPQPFPGGSGTPTPLWYFLPVVDGSLVPGSMYSLYETGSVVKVPLMVTDDTNEGTDFAVNATSTTEVAQFMKNNYPDLTQGQLDTIIQTYPRMKPLPQHAAYFPSAAAAYGESTFTCPGNLMAASLAQEFSASKVWNYRYNVQDPTEIAQGLGVPHVFDLPAIFGVGQTNEPTLSYANINANIIPITMDYYLSFIKALDPNVYRNENAPEWRPWGSGGGQRMKLQTNSTMMESVPQSQQNRCSIWKKLAVNMEQ